MCSNREIQLKMLKIYLYLHSSFTNRRTFIRTLNGTYIKIRWLLHVSVYDHHQGALQLSLAKFILILKHSVRLRRNLLCGCVAACPSMACVLCAVQSETKSFNINITLARLNCKAP